MSTHPGRAARECDASGGRSEEKSRGEEKKKKRMRKKMCEKRLQLTV